MLPTLTVFVNTLQFGELRFDNATFYTDRNNNLHINKEDGGLRIFKDRDWKGVDSFPVKEEK